MKFSNTGQTHFSGNQLYDVQGDLVQINGPTTLDILLKSSAQFAMHDSAQGPPPCHPGTRTEIFRSINKWTTNPFSPPICWVNGEAGTGKSAIAQSFAQACAREGRLAASFFCSRSDVDRSDGTKFFPTIVYQLMRVFPELEDPLTMVLDDDPTIFTKTIAMQLRKLIIEPLTQAIELPLRMIVVIDALDECDDKAAENIAKLITTAVSSKALPLHFLITSRPESHIAKYFARSDSVASVALRDFDVRRDIRLFLMERLQGVYHNHKDVMREVPEPWPPSVKIDLLVEKTQGLFMFAACVARFLGGRGGHSPDDQLNRILSFENNRDAYSELDRLYTHCVAQCTDTESFRLVLGTILVLRRPIALATLSVLLQCHITIGGVRAILLQLSSVFPLPQEEDEPIMIFHHSFRDFLTDRKRCGTDYFIDQEIHRTILMDSCLDHLNNPEVLNQPVDPMFRDAALAYAHDHCLFVANNRLYFVGPEATEPFHAESSTILAAAVIWGSLSGNILRHFVGNIIGTTLCIGVTTATLSAVSGIIGVLSAIQAGSDGLPCVIFGLFTMFLGLFYSLEGGARCLAPCEMGRSLAGSIKYGLVYDLFLSTLAKFYRVSKSEQDSPPVSNVRSTMRTIGRLLANMATRMGCGLVVAMITPHQLFVSGLLSIIAIAAAASYTSIVLARTLLRIFESMEVYQSLDPLNLNDITAEDFLQPSFRHLPVPLARQRCRWVKARYHYALRRRKSSLLTVGFPWSPIITARFYLDTLKPTHSNAKTEEEQRLCDWCR